MLMICSFLNLFNIVYGSGGSNEKETGDVCPLNNEQATCCQPKDVSQPDSAQYLICQRYKHSYGGNGKQTVVFSLAQVIYRPVPNNNTESITNENNCSESSIQELPSDEQSEVNTESQSWEDVNLAEERVQPSADILSSNDESECQENPCFKWSEIDFLSKF